MDLTKLYEEVFELLEEKSKLDPATDPYKSKYEAQEKLEKMKQIISSELDNNFSDESVSADQGGFPLLKAQQAAVLLHLGIIGLETEELSTGQEHLEKVLEVISGFEVSPLCISLAVLCHNNLAFLWCQRDEQEKAHQNLDEAKKLYLKYRNQDEAKPPRACHELFLTNCSQPGGWDVLEKLHTLTLYYLAQVVGKLGKNHESAYLCLTTLHRQLSSGEYQTMSWAINAATLAKFFQDNQKYRLARRLLAAGWTMLDCPVASSQNSASIPEESEEKFLETKAEVCRRWGMYCTSLLQDSFDSLSDTQEEEEQADDSRTTEEDEEGAQKSEEECLEQMEFCKLELSAVEEKAEWKKAATYDDAKKIFMTGLRWLTDARSFYTLEDHASTHTQIIQETSTLYKLLAAFDPAPDRRSKMYKRRVDLLTPVLEELNSQYYLEVCRQLDYELGETYTGMVDCKYEALAKATPNAQQATKINFLVTNAIKHFQNYLDTFISSSGEKPEKYPEGSERPVLVAYFHIGRLWCKMVSPSVSDKVRDITNSLESYKTLVDYCDTHPESASLMTIELPVCREMVELLPYKIRRIKNQG